MSGFRKGKLGNDPTDGSKRMGQLNHEYQAVLDRQPTITRCAVEGCSWTFEGEAADGREMFIAHRRLRHQIGMDDAGPEPTQEALQTSGDPDLDQIRDLLGHGQEVEIRLPREPQPWRREWIESLGGRIVIDPEAPMPLALQRDTEDGSVNGDEGRSALDAMDRGEAQRPERSAMANGTRAPKWTRESVIEAIQAFAREHEGRPPLQTELGGKNDLPTQSTLAKLFGSQSAAVEAAGFERPTRSRRVTAASQATPREPEPAESGTTRNDPEPPEEPAPLPVPAAPPEPPAPRPVAADPEHVDVFELFETMATQERIEFYERQAAAAQAKAEALKQIREALDTVKESA